MAKPVFKFQYALVCRIPNSFKDKSVREHEPATPIDLEKARKQHAAYVETLRTLGIDVLELPPDERHPDCTFVEDCAVVINGTALICKPGCPSRLGEVANIRRTLSRELGLKIVEVDNDNATLDGGDVLWTGKEIFVGLSSRTNMAGASAVANAFPEYPTAMIKVEGALHLKSLITMAQEDTFAVSKNEHAQKVLARIREHASYKYRCLTLEEKDAGNVLYANGRLVHLSDKEIPKSFPIYESKIDNLMPLELTEISKCQGNLSGMSILVNKIRNPKNYITSVTNEDLTRNTGTD